MKRKIDAHNQIVFICPNCGEIDETSIYLGGGDWYNLIIQSEHESINNLNVVSNNSKRSIREI